MSKRFGAIIGFAFFLLSPLANAQCVEDAREVRLDKDNIVRLKSYLCRAGQDANDPQISVEFHRFSNLAASILVGKQPAPKSMQATIGAPKPVENETFNSFAHLLREYGETQADPRSFALIAPGRNETTNYSDVTARNIRIIGGEPDFPMDYPNGDEIQNLQAKRIPASMRFYQGIANCHDDPDDTPSDGGMCRNYDASDISTTFWRSMTAADADNFRTNLAAYNRMLDNGRNRRPNGTGLFSAAAGEKYLKMLRYIAGDSWPDGLMHLSGVLVVDLCGEPDPDAVPDGLYGWRFKFWAHRIQLDAVSIRNTSRQPITLEGLFGEQSAPAGVRLASSSISLPATPQAISLASQTIAPGQSVLIPLRILLIPNPDWAAGYNPNEAASIYRRFGDNGFSGGGGVGAPEFKDFAYGPEVAISGVTVNGKRINLDTRADNLVDLSTSNAAGSCPYLLSWDDGHRDWVSHGKVLHKGQNKFREYSETKTFQSFRGVFRLEEREPEIAYIDHAEFVIALKSGETRALEPDNEKLSARDGNYLELMWGEGIDLTFRLPEGVVADDVLESRLTLTGYYERYSSLMAMNEQGARPRGAARFSVGPAQTRLCAIRRPLSINLVDQPAGKP